MWYKLFNGVRKDIVLFLQDVDRFLFANICLQIQSSYRQHSCHILQSLSFVVARKSSNKKQINLSAADHKNDKPLFEE